jgi:hypothetical protein
VAAINEIAKAAASATGIDDGVTSGASTWSSSKIGSEISGAISGLVGGAGAAAGVGPSSSSGSPVSGGSSGDTGISKTAKEDYAKMPAPNANGKGWGDMQATVMEAAKLTGTDPKELATIMAIESGFNPNAKSKTSSATGLNQFTSETWDEMMGKHAAKFGIDPKTPPTDPRANAIMGGMLLKQNKSYLKKTKSDVNLTDAYMAHFLGAGGATEFNKLDDNSIPARSMPKAAKSNQPIFFDRSGKPRTKAEIYKLMENKVNGALSQHGVNIDGASSGSSSSGETKPVSTTGAIGTSTPTGVTSAVKGPDSENTKAIRDMQNNSGLYKDTPKPTLPKAVSIGNDTAKGFESSDVSGVRATQALAGLAKRPDPVPSFESARVNTSSQAMKQNAGTVEDLLARSLAEHEKVAQNTAKMVELLQAFNNPKEAGVGPKGDAPPKVTKPEESVRSYSPDRTAKLVSSSPVSLRHNY